MNTLVLKRTPWERFKKGLFKYWEYYLMLIPGFALLILFSYAPMYGIMLAFKNLRMKKGIWGSPWANPWYLHFKTFFDSPYAYRLLRNTLIISITKVVLAKLAAVGLALLLNECHTSWYRRMVQTVSYMPHFLRWVVIYGITYLLCSESSGYINRVLSSSYSLKAVDDRNAAYLKEINGIFDRFSADGRIAVPTETVAYIGAV